MIKSDKGLGVIIGLTIGAVVGTLAGGLLYTLFGSTIIVALTVALIFTLIFAAYGGFMGILIDADTRDRHANHPHAAPYTAPRHKLDQSKTQPLAVVGIN